MNTQMIGLIQRVIEGGVQHIGWDVESFTHGIDGEWLYYEGRDKEGLKMFYRAEVRGSKLAVYAVGELHLTGGWEPIEELEVFGSELTTKQLVEYIWGREQAGIEDEDIDAELAAIGVAEEQIDEANDLYADTYLTMKGAGN